jgi:putative addiction module component (TIGR02574 family)
MTNRSPLPPPGFDDLPVEQQIDYVQLLWDRITAQLDRVPVPQWRQQVLDERLAAHEANPEPTTPWEEVREEIRSMASSMRASEYVAEQMRVGNL